MTDKSDEKKHAWDVDWLKIVHDTTSKKRGRLGRFLNRITWSLSSSVGIFTGIVFPVALIFGPLVAIVMILYYGGGIAFYASVATFFVLIGVIGEKKFGSSLQFRDYDFWRRTLAQVIGGSIVVGAFLLLLFLVK